MKSEVKSTVSIENSLVKCLIKQHCHLTNEYAMLTVHYIIMLKG